MDNNSPVPIAKFKIDPLDLQSSDHTASDMEVYRYSAGHSQRSTQHREAIAAQSSLETNSGSTEGENNMSKAREGMVKGVFRAIATPISGRKFFASGVMPWHHRSQNKEDGSSTIV